MAGGHLGVGTGLRARGGVSGPPVVLASALPISMTYIVSMSWAATKTLVLYVIFYFPMSLNDFYSRNNNIELVIRFKTTSLELH